MTGTAPRIPAITFEPEETRHETRCTGTVPHEEVVRILAESIFAAAGFTGQPHARVEFEPGLGDVSFDLIVDHDHAFKRTLRGER